MAHNHNHTPVCEHSTIKFCKDCKVPYCEKCGKEWQEKTYNIGGPWVSSSIYRGNGTLQDNPSFLPGSGTVTCSSHSEAK